MISVLMLVFRRINREMQSKCMVQCIRIGEWAEPFNKQKTTHRSDAPSFAAMFTYWNWLSFRLRRQMLGLSLLNIAFSNQSTRNLNKRIHLLGKYSFNCIRTISMMFWAWTYPKSTAVKLFSHERRHFQYSLTRSFTRSLDIWIQRCFGQYTCYSIFNAHLFHFCRICCRLI